MDLEGGPHVPDGSAGREPSSPCKGSAPGVQGFPPSPGRYGGCGQCGAPKYQARDPEALAGDDAAPTSASMHRTGFET